MAQIKKVKFYTKELVESTPDHLYIFGDNLQGFGTGGQAVIRYCENSYGVPTKKSPSRSDDAFFYDSEFTLNTNAIKKAIDDIPATYDIIVFPEDGLGTGLAELPLRAPKTYKFLVHYLNLKFGEVLYTDIHSIDKYK